MVDGEQSSFPFSSFVCVVLVSVGVYRSRASKWSVVKSDRKDKKEELGCEELDANNLVVRALGSACELVGVACSCHFAGF